LRTHRDIIGPESDSIGELAEALLHRKAPKALFMILTAYMDESGTHGPSPVSVMAACVGEVRQWRKFEKRVGKLFRRYGVTVYHSIDLKRGDGDFRGWSVDKKIEFLDELAHIKNETLAFSCAVHMKKSDYVSFYANKDRPKRVIRDTQYGVLFRAALAYVLQGILRVPELARDKDSIKLRLVLESGHPNAADAVRLYKFFRSNGGEKLSDTLAGIAFEFKDKCIPLSVADLLAYNTYVVETGGKRIGVAKRPLKSVESLRQNSWRFPVNQVALEQLYQQSLDFHERRQKFGRRTSLDAVLTSAAQSSETSPENPPYSH
jgi:hypothetical protein